MIPESEQKQAIDQLVTCRDAMRWAMSAMARGKVFLGHGTDNYWDEALALMLHVLALPWDSDPALLDSRLLASERERFVALVCRRVNERQPTPYLTGEAWFCGMPFFVDERVLIPRSPIGELIEQGFAPWFDPDAESRVLDLCTGSGCIAIACAMAMPQARVEAADISADALAVCEQNIQRHGLAGRVVPRQGDGLEAVQGRFDLIVSNPPYVDAADMASVPEEYRREPELALASGADGLDFTRRLLAGAADYLSDDGILVVEVGNSAEALAQCYPEVPFFWFEFSRGGDGVFMLSAAQLQEYRDLFRERV
ncbi:MAG: 50S ribosomal protein L3 N(5)-glutamine methyltransferase [Alcanivoracaceae bacterium]|nr:50S ribosomal protein L3 N(5)-glutamine methyltransferase [Alcanivoracaceae bacterium]